MGKRHNGEREIEQGNDSCIWPGRPEGLGFVRGSWFWSRTCGSNSSAGKALILGDGLGLAAGAELGYFELLIVPGEQAGLELGATRMGWAEQHTPES